MNQSRFGIEQKHEKVELMVTFAEVASATDTHQTVDHTVESIQSFIVSSLAKVLQLNTEDISADTQFVEYGIDSVVMFELLQLTEEYLGQSLDIAILWNFPTPKLLAEYLSSIQISK
ncbi:hypothetical protein NIES2101_13175 [Calothrix sp. HK-06]|nr:hypothetical protein NIES2101_13175 [Calothrix sp. HK-06]